VIILLVSLGQGFGTENFADSVANYSRELADYIIYVIDVSGGDKIPRKGGPGISQSDLLIVNKVSPHLPNQSALPNLPLANHSIHDTVLKH